MTTDELFYYLRGLSTPSGSKPTKMEAFFKEPDENRLKNMLNSFPVYLKARELEVSKIDVFDLTEMKLLWGGFKEEFFRENAIFY